MAKIVVNCIDPRMTATLPALEAKLGIKAYQDKATGGSLGVDHEYDHIQKIIRLTNADELYLFDHLQCARYKEKYGDLTEERERELHIEMLRQRGKELREKFPELKEIHLCLLTDVTAEAIGTDFEEIAAEGSDAVKEAVQVA